MGNPVYAHAQNHSTGRKHPFGRVKCKLEGRDKELLDTKHTNSLILIGISTVLVVPHKFDGSFLHTKPFDIIHRCFAWKCREFELCIAWGLQTAECVTKTTFFIMFPSFHCFTCSSTRKAFIVITVFSMRYIFKPKATWFYNKRLWFLCQL